MSERQITSETAGDDIGLVGERINSEAKVAQPRASIEVAVGEFLSREADQQDRYGDERPRRERRPNTLVLI